MIWPTWWHSDDELVWIFPFFDPVTDSDAPPNWTRAMEAVARDIASTSSEHESHLTDTSWELRMGPDYAMTLGWVGKRGLSGFSVGAELEVDSDNAETTVWVATTLQSALEDLVYVRWPLRSPVGFARLQPVLRDSAPVWMDPRTGAAIARIGELRSS